MRAAKNARVPGETWNFSSGRPRAAISLALVSRAWARANGEPRVPMRRVEAMRRF